MAAFVMFENCIRDPAMDKQSGLVSYFTEQNKIHIVWTKHKETQNDTIYRIIQNIKPMIIRR